MRLPSIILAGALALGLAGCGRSAPEESADDLEASTEIADTTVPTTTAVTEPPTTAPPPTQPEYVVQQGDSLSRIAERFGVSTQALADFNGIEDPNAIQVGQKLTIPPTTVADG